MTRIPRVGVVVEPRYLAQAQPAGAVAALSVRDLHLVDVHTEDDLAGCHVVVARGRSAGVLELLDLAEARGIRTMNRADAIRAVVDKWSMQQALRAAGVRTPTAWCGTIDELLGCIPQHDGPVVVKPVRGDNCRDVTVLPDGAALRHLAWAEPEAIVQRHVPGDGMDLKLYGIGDIVWAVRKPSPLVGTGTAAMIALRPEHVAIAHACRDTFGLDAYGVDCIDTPDGPVVIEVNDFPNYTGIAAADDRLADHVLSLLNEMVPA